jgi:hypothetical protein
MPVRFSTRAPNADYLGFEASHGAIVTAAKKAEEVGFDGDFGQRPHHRRQRRALGHGTHQPAFARRRPSQAPLQ